MEITFADNAVRSLADFISLFLPQAIEAKFAVAFVKYSGLALIEDDLLACLEKGGKIEFLVGLDFRTTEGKALRQLKALAESTQALELYCYSDPSFGDSPVYHPKLYLFNREQEVDVIIGSSNLTAGGLKKNAEINVVIIANPQDEFISDVYGVYNRLKFQRNRFKPDLEFIDDYDEVYQRLQRHKRRALQEAETKRRLERLREKEQILPKPVPSGKELFGWQNLVFERLPDGPFRTSDMYVFAEEFQRCYPENRNIKPKVRQILQQLRDMGLLNNPQRDRWERL